MDAAKLQSFRYWLTQDVERTFGVEQVERHDLLEKWLEVDCRVSDFEHSQIKEMPLLTMLHKKIFIRFSVFSNK